MAYDDTVLRDVITDGFTYIQKPQSVEQTCIGSWTLPWTDIMGQFHKWVLNPGLDRAKTWFGETWSRPGLDQVLFWISQLLWTGFRPGFTKPGLSPV